MEQKVSLTAPSVIAGLLREHGLRLRKSLGQHFLCDGNILNKIIAAAELSPADLVIEPGAGFGTLTLALAARAGRVIAVELDPKLVQILQANLAESGSTNVEVLQRDFLGLDLAGLIASWQASSGPARAKAKVVGNLPYQITSPILEMLMAHWRQLALAVLMVQHELAERLAAPPRPRASALGVQLQAVADVELLAKVPRTAFFPPPEVDSALIRLVFLERPRIEAEEGLFSRVVRAAFNLRRKTIKQALIRSPFLRLSEGAAVAALQEAGLEPRRRGESLSLEEFDRLAQAIARSGAAVGRSRGL
ncbi:MAG: 16S rRNA (adenine(1518)-N(6)/adenine(1519)-N(6))-dimethyltransferase RsmA [Candidatus Acetothermia bacterium]|jgi:16S rRNA (adenine1518-N6/adenine1519-N6)-dimethyltransferase|nr:16S rRNA (adenine(1518)-N(6)/adenine(1519)-N(6))-dimethyltransferase RsmA [Candidatus Acetothermia bacterium]MDH7504583.1 16S rRNA (adenine(1518)-N(6)/adenine(1519)-N(6))-dimethyltransferase RsmA [Candidatus Acetothermia bacterium]